MVQVTRAELAPYIEHSLYLPQATRQDVERLCAEARQHRFHGVCVHGSRVELAASLLEDTEVKVACLVGFPLGAMDSDVKRYEAEAAIDQGAQEIEAVINIGRLKDGDHRFVVRELRDIAEAAEERPVKAVLETALLTAEEIHAACQLALDSGVNFVTAGTGWTELPSVAQVKALRAAVGIKFGVKAAGPIANATVAWEYIQAGATRLGMFDSLTVIAGVPA
jgi:deoxyribose-phosphate aldolase